jgi:hypothetical protein
VKRRPVVGQVEPKPDQRLATASLAARSIAAGRPATRSIATGRNPTGSVSTSSVSTSR